MPHSKNADQPEASRGRDTEHRQTRTNSVKQPVLFLSAKRHQEPHHSNFTKNVQICGRKINIYNFAYELFKVKMKNCK